MKHLPIVCALVAIATSLTAPVAHAQNLVTNPGFETGNFTGWTQTPASSGSGNFVTSSVANTGGSSAVFSATNFEVDTLSQTIATTPGASYTFSFFLRNAGSVQDSFSASWNGNTVYNFINSGSNFPFTQFSFDVIATGASTPIAFAGYDAPDFIYLDDVSVVAVVVPEASTFALALPALAVVGTALVRRRKR